MQILAVSLLISTGFIAQDTSAEIQILNAKGRTTAGLSGAERALRSRLLFSLIAEDPRAALSLADPSLGDTFSELEGTPEGIVIEHSERRKSEVTWSLRNVELHFADSTPPPCGKTLQLNGLIANGRMAVSSYKVGPPELTFAECSNWKTERKIAVLLVNMPNFKLPADMTPALAREAFFGNGFSVNKYWQEASYGLVSASGEVFTVNLSRDFLCSDYAETLRAAVAAATGVDFTKFHHVVAIQPGNGLCPSSAVAYIGCSAMTQPGSGVGFAAGLSWIFVNESTSAGRLATLGIHELGHNLGLQHARLASFPGYPLGAFSDAEFAEYGDPWSAMANLGHYAAAHKIQLGWLTDSMITSVSQPGTYTIGPYTEAGSKPKVLRVRRGPSGSEWLSIEYRTKAGFDRDLQVSDEAYGGAVIHFEPTVSNAATYLLNFHPSTSLGWIGIPGNAPLSPMFRGETWKDPHSPLRLTVNSATPEGLTVTVSHENSCLTLSPPGAAPNRTGSTGTVTVSAATGCSWTAVSSSPWITIHGNSSGIGNGSFAYTVAPNLPGRRRNGNITVGSQVFPIEQEAGCEIVLTTPAMTVSAAGLTRYRLTFVNGSLCSTAEISGFSPWIQVTATSGTWLEMNIWQNTSTVPRTGTLNIGKNVFTVQQLGSEVSGQTFVPMTPCRLLDTRLSNGPLGGPILGAQESREFPVLLSNCPINPAVSAYSLNLTVVPQGPLGYVTLWQSGTPRPLASTLNSLDGRIKANAAIIPSGTNGKISIYATDRVHVVVDIVGYFVPSGGYSFYPVKPCRLVDTRLPNSPLGGPSLEPMQPRSLPVLSAGCGLPDAAKSYSLNITAVPRGPLGFVTTWPTGVSRPVVSTLNALTGAITANAATVSAGTNGEISVFATDKTDLIVDVNGYFAPPTPEGLRFYPVSPCRVLDTRTPNGLLTPFATEVDQERTIPAGASLCNTPIDARAISLNATVIPEPTLGFLTLWAQGTARPVVSTLNALDGSITSNAALVPSTNGTIQAFATDRTALIIDISGYFAP